MDYSGIFSEPTLAMKSSMIRELVASTKGIPDMISFAGGFPAPATFPAETLAGIYHDVILKDGSDVLQYGSSEGDLLLKAALKKLEGLDGLPDSRMLINAGATHAIYLYARTLIDPGDVIITEAPSFLGTLVALQAVGAELAGVPMDEHGVRADLLESTILRLRKEGRNLKFIYLIPEFQNPSGITMNLERKKEILAISIQYNVPILEDNPYGYLRYSGESSPSLYHLARELYPDQTPVTLVKSFSKVLGPGLRMAYTIGDETLIGRMGSWLQKVNVSTDCVTQRAVARFLEEGLLDEHLRKLCDYYRPARDAMLSALEREMPQEIQWTRPEGGMFVWLTLPGKMDADELFPKARDRHVAFIPGSKFFAPGFEQYNTLRLNFSYPTLEQIDLGVKRLAGLIRNEL